MSDLSQLFVLQLELFSQCRRFHLVCVLIVVSFIEGEERVRRLDVWHQNTSESAQDHILLH